MAVGQKGVALQGRGIIYFNIVKLELKGVAIYFIII